MNDNHKEIVERPNHYAQLAVEPIEFIMRNEFPYALGNAIKYISRAGEKVPPGMTAKESAIIDLKKAKRYLEMQINLIKGEDEL